MILTGSEIQKQVERGRITIDPFDPEYLTTNSYDFHLDTTLLVYQKDTLDVHTKNPTRSITIPPEGLILQPNKLYLGNTLEIIGSDHYVPIIRGKSSTGRIGLFVHITADLIDIGSMHQLTLMLHATQPVRIYPGMLIGQVTFWEVKGDIAKLYDGKYQGLPGPQPSQIYRDFEAKAGNT